MKKQSPYTAGIVDGLKCAGMIRASDLGTKNRLAFLILDSILEIALRIYLKHERRISLDKTEHRSRHALLKLAKQNIEVDEDVWKYLTYCYKDIRCPLYHEAADMTVTDPILDDFTEMVCFLINKMFGVPAVELVDKGGKSKPAIHANESQPIVDPNSLENKVDAIILSVGLKPAPDSRSIQEHLEELGYTKRLTTKEISAYLTQGRYFYKDRKHNLWKLTAVVGLARYKKLTEPKEEQL